MILINLIVRNINNKLEAIMFKKSTPAMSSSNGFAQISGIKPVSSTQRSGIGKGTGQIGQGTLSKSAMYA